MDAGFLVFCDVCVCVGGGGQNAAAVYISKTIGMQWKIWYGKSVYMCYTFVVMATNCEVIMMSLVQKGKKIQGDYFWLLC